MCQSMCTELVMIESEKCPDGDYHEIMLKHVNAQGAVLSTPRQK